MDVVIALFLFPAVVAVLAIGAGLLVDRVVGGSIPGVLTAPLGFALLVVVAELCGFSSFTAPLTPGALVVVGLAGLIVGFGRLRALRPDPWPLAATVAVYLMVVAPVLLSGRVTVPGYLLDTTVAYHLTASDYLIDQARDFARLPDSAFRNMLQNYFGTQYPSGGHTLLGGAGRLVATDRIWLYQPFMALLLAFCTPTLYFLSCSAALPRALAAGAAVLASVPALVYAYAQMGAIKELTVLPSVLLLGASLVLLPRLLDRGWRGAFFPALVAAAGIGAIGLAFVPWFAATLVAGMVLVFIGSRRDLRRPPPLLAWGAALVGILLLLALPTFGPLTKSIQLAQSFSTSNVAAVADPGNLLRPLLNEQMLGIWLGGSHRVDPPGRVAATYLLIGIVAVAVALGAAYLIRRRLWALVAFSVLMTVVWLLLTRRGATWTDAKLLVITSPVAVLLACVGVESLRRAGRRVEAGLVGAAIAGGILFSNAFAYHDTNLQPTERYQELLQIGERFAGLAPTLTPEFDEFYFYALPELATDGPGNAQRTERIARLSDGSLTGYGHSYDVDLLPLEQIQQYEAIVVRRRPDASRPPVGFERVYRGVWYEVWKRGGPRIALAHEPAGSGLDPTSEVKCREVRRLSERALAAGAKLAFVERPQLTIVDGKRLQRLARPVGWVSAVPEGIALFTPGLMDIPLSVPRSGRYLIWLRGDFGRPLSVSVDGELVGEVSYESGNEGNYARALPVRLDEGNHRLTLERGGGKLKPGDASPSRLLAVVLEPDEAAIESRQVHTLPPERWRELCNRDVDWIEVVRSS